MPTVLLIRHGHVEGIAPERFRGRWDLPLTPLGRDQAQAVAAHLRQRWPGARAVYASPLARCRDTAAAIATALGLGVQTVEGLADLDYGAWQGLTRAEAATRWPDLVDRWFIAPHRVRIPGGESLLDLTARASRALAACLDAVPGDATIALVAHDSVNRVLLCEVLGLSLAQYLAAAAGPVLRERDRGGSGVPGRAAQRHRPSGRRHRSGRGRRGSMRAHLFPQPRQQALAAASVLQHLRPLHRDQAAFHHLVQDRQEAGDLVLAIDDLDHHRQVLCRRPKMNSRAPVPSGRSRAGRATPWPRPDAAPARGRRLQGRAAPDRIDRRCW